MKTRLDQRGAADIILILLLVAVIGVGAYAWWHYNQARKGAYAPGYPATPTTKEITLDPGDVKVTDSKLSSKDYAISSYSYQGWKTYSVGTDAAPVSVMAPAAWTATKGNDGSISFQSPDFTILTSEVSGMTAQTKGALIIFNPNIGKKLGDLTHFKAISTDVDASTGYVITVNGIRGIAADGGTEGRDLTISQWDVASRRYGLEYQYKHLDKDSNIAIYNQILGSIR